MKFLERAETDRSWTEVAIDVWLQTGQEWLGAAKFGLAKGFFFQNQALDDRESELAYVQAFADLLKASWMLIDVVGQHPQRPYVTSGHRQASIKAFAKDVASRLDNLKTSAILRPSSDNILHQAIHDVFAFRSSAVRQVRSIRPDL